MRKRKKGKSQLSLISIYVSVSDFRSKASRIQYGKCCGNQWHDYAEMFVFYSKPEWKTATTTHPMEATIAPTKGPLFFCLLSHTHTHTRATKLHFEKMMKSYFAVAIGLKPPILGS